MIETRILPAGDPQAIQQAVLVLQGGGLVAFPTDTVYGVGALAHDPAGIQQLFIVKGREAAKAIPILIGDPSDLPRVAQEVGEMAFKLARRFWPGALTLVLPRHAGLPPNLGLEPTVGVRMPDHPAALALLRLAGPMAVTSANLSGGPNTTSASEVFSQLGGRIPLLLDGGRTPGGDPSTVVDCTGPEPRILRPGPVTYEEILQALN